MYTLTIKNTELVLRTNDEVFSPSAADRGTLAMLGAVELSHSDKVLDLGCGCGIVGILAAKIIGEERVVMCDVSENAVALSMENAAANGVPFVKILQSDGFSAVTDRDFTLVLSNPPYHTDFSVAKGFIENGFHHLAVGGKMVMVTKRLDWYKNKLTAVFGGTRVKETDGYFVFVSEKRAPTSPKKEKPPRKLSKKLAKKYGKTPANEEKPKI